MCDALVFGVNRLRNCMKEVYSVYSQSAEATKLQLQAMSSRSSEVMKKILSTMAST